MARTFKQAVRGGESVDKLLARIRKMGKMRKHALCGLLPFCVTYNVDARVALEILKWRRKCYVTGMTCLTSPAYLPVVKKLDSANLRETIAWGDGVARNLEVCLRAEGAAMAHVAHASLKWRTLCAFAASVPFPTAVLHRIWLTK